MTPLKTKFLVSLLVTFLFLLYGGVLWGIWELVQIIVSSDTDSFWIKRAIIVLFSILTAVAIFFVTNHIKNKIEQASLLRILNVLQAEVERYNSEEVRQKSSIEMQDIKPLMKYVLPHDYVDIARIVNILNDLYSGDIDNADTALEGGIHFGFEQLAKMHLEFATFCITPSLLRKESIESARLRIYNKYTLKDGES